MRQASSASKMYASLPLYSRWIFVISLSSLQLRYHFISIINIRGYIKPLIKLFCFRGFYLSFISFLFNFILIFIMVLRRICCKKLKRIRRSVQNQFKTPKISLRSRKKNKEIVKGIFIGIILSLSKIRNILIYR